MARKLKTYETSLGFFDLAVAAPSMKAALEAWGAESNLFHQGVANEGDDPDVVAATLAAPGVVLKRPVGSNKPFKVHAELPTHISDSGGRKRAHSESKSHRLREQPNRKKDEPADRAAALAFEREQKSR